MGACPPLTALDMGAAVPLPCTTLPRPPMREIVYLISQDLLPDAPDARSDRFELDLQVAALSPALANVGARLDLQVWDDPHLMDRVRAPNVACVVIGTPWDYAGQVQHFLDTLDALARVRPVLNAPDLVRWNAKKTYLADLEARGISTIPTLFVDRVDPPAVAQAFAHFGCTRLVAKPVIGAGAHRQVLLHHGQALPHPDLCPPAGALLQPYLPSIEQDGELSLIFVGRTFSHALQKRPQKGDYRVQSMYGGWETPTEPSPQAIALATRALDAIPHASTLLYARVDLVQRDAGSLAVIELELIEPYLYPVQGPALGPLFARRLAALQGW